MPAARSWSVGGMQTATTEQEQGQEKRFDLVTFTDLPNPTPFA